MGSKREQIVAAGLILATLLLAMLVSPGDEQSTLDPRASTFRASPQGARALYLTLDELGIPAEQRLTPYVDADSLAGPLALLAPAESPTPGELAALARWIEAGGTLLYAARPGDLTLDTLGLVLHPPEERIRRAAQAAIARPRPHRWTEGLGPVSGFRRSFADTSRVLRSGDATPLLALPAGEATVVVFRRGRGTVVAWSDPQPLTNAELRESGAALLFARAAQEATAGERPLRFDEYHQGFRAGGSPPEAILAFLREQPLGHATLQLALAGVGLLLLLGRRFGAPQPPPPARRRSPLEHVEALAGAYRQAGARTTARRLLVAGLARRLGRPVPPAGREEDLLAGLAGQLLVGRHSAGELLAEWRKGPRAGLVSLARHTDHLIAETQRP